MANVKTDIKYAFSDIERARKEQQIWLALGWNDLKTRYNRSKLGVFWACLSLFIFVTALGFVYSSIMEVDTRIYMMHLLLGFIVWNYISAIIMESGREFINSTNYLESFQLSYFTLLLRVVWRNLIVFGYQMLVFVFFSLMFQQPLSVNWIIAPLALLLITINTLWMGLLMSVLATRYRDLSELINNILRLVFFVTPIIWMPGFKKDLEFIADINPFYHLIEIFREPLAQGTISWNSWFIVIIMSLIGWLIALPIFVKYRSRIAFWL